MKVKRSLFEELKKVYDKKRKEDQQESQQYLLTYTKECKKIMKKMGGWILLDYNELSNAIGDEILQVGRSLPTVRVISFSMVVNNKLKIAHSLKNVTTWQKLIEFASKVYEDDMYRTVQGCIIDNALDKFILKWREDNPNISMVQRGTFETKSTEIWIEVNWKILKLK